MSQSVFWIGSKAYRMATAMIMGKKETFPTRYPEADQKPASEPEVIMMPGEPGPAGKDGTDGVDGEHGKDGQNATDAQVAQAAANYIAANESKFCGQPGKDGKDGKNGRDGIDGINGTNGREIQFQKTATYLQWRYVGDTSWTNLVALADITGPAGKDGKDGTNGTNGTNGKDGQNGTGMTLLGQVTIGQTATVAISLGLREVTVALTGAVVGERYACFVRSYKLNGGATVQGRPSGYAIVDCVCNTAGQITVTLNAPLLSIGSSYALVCDIMKVA